MKRPLGKVSSCAAIELGEFREYLFSKRYVEATIYSDEGYYISLKPVDESYCWTNKQWSLHFGKNYLLRNHSITFRLSDFSMNKRRFELPVAFMKLTNIEIGDVLKVWKKGESIIIEGKEGICAVSGDSISRYKNRKNLYNVSKKTFKILPEIQEEMSKHRDFTFKERVAISINNVLNNTTAKNELISQITKTIENIKKVIAE